MHMQSTEAVRDFDEMETWLKENPTATQQQQPQQGGAAPISSNGWLDFYCVYVGTELIKHFVYYPDFDKFLSERAAAAETKPDSRQIQKDDDDAMFAL